MALVLADRVLETTGVTGTGDASLNGAQTNFQPFSVVGNGSTTYYTIVDNTNNEWEVGIGTYISAGNKLSRDTVLSSSNGGALVYFASGTKDIFCDLPAEKVASTGAVIYKGTWNASTNTPALTSSVGTQGDYYIVSVAGSTDLNGITDWKVGDWAIFNGSVWQKVDNTDLVTSVNGQTGAVVLTASDVGAQPAGSYAPATSGTSILYGNGTGGFSNVTVGTGLSFTGGTLATSGSATGDVVGPASATDNAIARFDSTTGKLIQNSTVTVSDAGVVDGVTHMNDVDYIDFDTTYSTTLGAGQLGWNGNDTLGLGMIGGNVIQHIGEDQFFYCKATSTITKGQVVMFTGAVGASGVPTGAPATGITDGTYIMGIAAEDIANNDFGLVQSFGTLRNVNTSGYADGDILWYNPAVTGGLTKTKPVAPNVKAQMAAVINGGSSGGGTILIRINPGSTLGGTDSNAEISTPSNGQIITYDGLDGYWKNTTLTAGTAISVSTSSTGVLTITNSAPDQTVSLTAGTGMSVTGTYPSFTLTNTAPDQVVSLTGAGTTTVTGTYPSFTITSNDAYTGTVTSVGGTGSVNGITLTGTVTSSGDLTLGGTLSGIGNSQLTNSSVTVNGTTISLGASGTITAANPNAMSAGTGLSFTGAGTYDGSAAKTLNLSDTAVSAGSYTYASITVDAQGRLTAASNGASPSAFPSGTVMLFGQTSAPTGWTKDTTNYNNSGLRVVTGTASTGGSVDFTTAFASQTPTGSVTITSVAGSAGATTLTTPQIPSHTHTWGPSKPGPGAVYGPGGGFGAGPQTTGATGGNGSHTHPFSFSSGAGTFSGNAINLAVKYVDVIRATKD